MINKFDLKEEDVGTGVGLFEVKKIGDEYFTYLTGCADPKACTVLLRGPSKDLLNEIERNLQVSPSAGMFWGLSFSCIIPRGHSFSDVSRPVS